MSSFRKMAMIRSFISDRLMRIAADEPSPSSVPDFLSGAKTQEDVFRAIISVIRSVSQEGVDRDKTLDGLSEYLSSMVSGIAPGLIKGLAGDFLAGIPSTGGESTTREEAGAHAHAIIRFREIANALHKKLFPKPADADAKEKDAEEAPAPAAREEESEEPVSRSVEIDVNDHPWLKSALTALSESVGNISSSVLKVSEDELKHGAVVRLIQKATGQLSSAVTELHIEDNRQRARINALVGAAAEAARAETGLSTIAEKFSVGPGSQGKDVHVSERQLFHKAEKMSLEDLEKIFKDDRGAVASNIMKILDGASSVINEMQKANTVRVGDLKSLFVEMSDQTRKNLVTAKKNMELARKNVDSLLSGKFAKNQQLINLSQRVGDAESMLARVEQVIPMMEEAINRMAFQSVFTLLRRAAEELSTMVGDLPPETSSMLEEIAPAEVDDEEDPSAELPADVSKKIEDIDASISESMNGLISTESMDSASALLGEIAAANDEMASEISDAYSAMQNLDGQMGPSRQASASGVSRRAAEETESIPFPGAPKKKKTDQPATGKGKKEIPARPKGAPGEKKHKDPSSEDLDESSLEAAMWNHLPKNMSAIVDNLKTAVGSYREMDKILKEIQKEIKDSWNFSEVSKVRKADREELQNLLRKLDAEVLPNISKALLEIDGTLNKAGTMVKMGKNIVEFTGSHREVLNVSPETAKKWVTNNAKDLLLLAEQNELTGGKTAKELLAELQKLLSALGPIGVKVTSYVPREPLSPGAKEQVDILKETVVPSRERVEEALNPDAPESEAKSEPGYVEYGQGVGSEFSDPSRTKAAIIRGLSRTSEEEEINISSELKTLSSAMDGVSDSFENAMPILKGYSDGMGTLSDVLSQAYNDISAASDEGADREPGIMDWLSGLSQPSEAAPAFAAASQEHKMIRKAEDFSRFDTSENKLEIVEGEGGKKKILINKNLKNLVTKRIVELAKGAHPDGLAVNVDCDDYLARGVVQSYLGNDVYSIRLEGSALPSEVPASRIIPIEEGPWR